jgi:hypothetical protein
MTLLEVGLLVFVVIGVMICTIRSLGLGCVALIAVGYFHGYIRANYLGIATTFMFDAALLGLYLGFFVFHSIDAVSVWFTTAGQWVIALMCWPALMCLVPVNDYLVQLVSLRATIWFLPVLLVASRLRADDLVVIARGLSVLNIAAFAGGLYVYRYGVESLYPDNAVTQIIYRSNDVAGYQYHRVPSFFLSSHAYGGTMVYSLPFILGLLFSPKTGFFNRSLATAGLIAALGGILLCATRQPAATFVLAAVAAWVVSRLHPAFGIVAAGLVATALVLAASDERLQRLEDLADSDLVSRRIQVSANESFLQLMADYPAGAGMGSSFGTSIPFFLADRAPKPVGLENEYSRILVDQGVVGLALWLAFLLWLLHRPPPVRLGVPWGAGIVLMYALVVTSWAIAFIGAGTLSSIPGSVMLLAQMGVLVRVRAIATGHQP